MSKWQGFWLTGGDHDGGNDGDGGVRGRVGDEGDVSDGEDPSIGIFVKTHIFLLYLQFEWKISREIFNIVLY